ncbi:MAG: beta-ketoacyl-ACP synthase II [Thermodesulfobacteriota bacterium]
MARRVVVTGIGLLTPLGIGTEASWKACLEGRSGISRIHKFDPTAFKTQVAGQLEEFDRSKYIDAKEARRYDDFCQYALVAAQMALEDSGLKITEDLRERTGVIVGTGFGGLETFERNFKSFLEGGPRKISPFFIPMMIANMASGLVAIRYGIRGPNTCTVTACAASSHAIGDAFKAIQRNQAEVMFAGGTEASLTALMLAGFDVMKATSTRNHDPQGASRPFDRDRDGFVPAEGAAMLILEELEHARRRGAKIYAELTGYGSSNDAYHFTAPDPEGKGAALCMRMALEDASLSPDQVDYVNAHGTSTPLNDAIETLAIKKVFGEHAYRLAVSSTKSMTGHLLGAAGAAEAAFTCLAIRDQMAPPTINYQNPDPDCDLDYVPNKARPMRIRTALSNSFGFGGTNACLTFGALDEID